MIDGISILKFFFSDFFGSLCLVFFGNGAVACFELYHSKGTHDHRGGLNWLGIGVGYGFGTMIACVTSGYSNHQFNPAASFALVLESFGGDDNIYSGHQWMFIIALGAQFSGAFLAQLIVDLLFLVSMKDTEDTFKILSMHATTLPDGKNSSKKLKYFIAFMTECLGTFILLVPLRLGEGLFNKANHSGSTIFLDHPFYFAVTAGIMVMLLVISVGGVTGPALNPTRDLAPRLVYWLLPLPNKQKGTAQWGYSWVPVVAPLCGGALAAGVILLLKMANY
jgi:glycerol uptake facilitator protein